MNSIYIINPRECSPSFYGSEVFPAWGLGRAPILADVVIVTVAAFVPPTWTVRLCDERVEEADLDHDCDIVALTGKVSQRERMFELARAFRARGRLVLIGGAHASLDPQDVRPHADVLVRGEIEGMAATLFADLEADRARPDYECPRPDLGTSPVPRWDLYPQGAGLVGQVQTSRGCPFDCEFCDVIQYLGRKQRWKEPRQVIAELDLLYGLGYREVFLADDNFTVVRRRATELLEAIAAWNRGKGADRMLFTTQLSIDVTRTPELLALAAEAGLARCFIGIETPNEESLLEARKRQNMRIDIAGELRAVAAAGIMPMAGLIVGFDHDGPDIFSRQAEFAETMPAPNLAAAMLVAPRATPLHQRMQAEGRLSDPGPLGGGHFLTTNIVPKRMTGEDLRSGLIWLLNRLYEPSAWLARLARYVELAPRLAVNEHNRGFTYPEIRLAQALARRGRREKALIDEIAQLCKARPDLIPNIGYSLMFYCQARHMMDWGAVWAEAAAAREDARVA
jgi:hypothetical protein